VAVGSELDFLHPLPVGALWGVGKVTAARLQGLGISTIGELSEVPSAAMRPQLGPAASRALRSLAWNRDPRPVQGGRRAGSVGSQHALGPGLVSRDEMAVVVLGLADRVGRRLRAKGRTGSTLTVRARFPGPRSVSRSHTLPAQTGSTAALSNLGMTLLERALDDNPGEAVTLIGISVSNLTTDDYVQLELDLGDGDLLRSGSDLALRRSKLEGQVDEVRERFGRDLVRYGIGADGASDDFRRLAEKS
jgi:DNA polymerase-4